MEKFYQSVEEDYIFWEYSFKKKLLQFKKRDITNTSFLDCYKLLKSLDFDFTDIKSQFKFEINKLGWRNFYEREDRIQTEIIENNAEISKSEKQRKEELEKKLKLLKSKYENNTSR